MSDGAFGHGPGGPSGNPDAYASGNSDAYAEGNPYAYGDSPGSHGSRGGSSDGIDFLAFFIFLPVFVFMVFPFTMIVVSIITTIAGMDKNDEMTAADFWIALGLWVIAGIAWLVGRLRDRHTARR